MTAPVRTNDHPGEPDRASIVANGIVVDVIANDDGTVSVETYAYLSGKVAGGDRAVVIDEQRRTLESTRFPTGRGDLITLSLREEA